MRFSDLTGSGAALALFGLLALGTGACGDSNENTASGTQTDSDSGGSDTKATAGSDGTTAGSESSGTDSDSQTSDSSSPSGTDGESQGSSTDGGSDSSNGSGSTQGTSDTTGGEFSTGDSGEEPTTSTTGDPPKDLPEEYECADFNLDQQACEEAEGCAPALAERYNLEPTQVCKDDGVFFLGCLEDNACNGADVIYCFGNEVQPYFDFVDGCVPEDYSPCSIPQQDNYPPC
ncbi:MAG: hypothetical protein R3A51_02185 [Nannocystaceae bacterium]|nr:hypothetical protein [Myxococcales bacterium]